MRSNLAKSSIGLVFFALLSCAPFPQTSGTVADATLQVDVMQMISRFEAAAGRSKQPTFVSARGTAREGSTVVEHWDVTSNGRTVTYVVMLTPSPRGGVDYRVRFSTGPTAVKLRDGKTYEVEISSGRPVRFRSGDISVQDLGITAAFTPDQADAPPFVWVLQGALLAAGQFEVTITTPLDSSASETLRANPGRITLQFFPQSKYPLIWEGIDQPGVHWFPFRFVFEEKQSKTRFEFTQWAQIDSGMWKEMRALNEEFKKKYLKK